MAGAARTKKAGKKRVTRGAESSGKKAKKKAKKKAAATSKTRAKAAPKKVRKTTAATGKRAPQRADKSPRAGVTEQILGELRSLHSLMESPPARPVSPDEILDDAVLSLRRVLSELLGRRMDAFAATLADLRGCLGSDHPDLDQAVGQLDGLLDELGVIRFDAGTLDYPDPLIHTVVRERTEPSAPNGVVLETLDTGLRTRDGTVLAKARVVVNRRS